MPKRTVWFPSVSTIDGELADASWNPIKPSMHPTRILSEAEELVFESEPDHIELHPAHPGQVRGRCLTEEDRIQLSIGSTKIGSELEQPVFE